MFVGKSTAVSDNKCEVSVFMDDLYYKKFEPFWGTWYIKRFIGEGSFGKCYEIEKKDISGTYTAALKIITVPPSKEHVKNISSTGMSADDVSNYFRDIARDVATEFKLMEKFKGTTNIVSYEDHEIRDHEDGIGCDIFIRMELLTPLNEYYADIRRPKKIFCVSESTSVGARNVRQKQDHSPRRQALQHFHFSQRRLQTRRFRRCARIGIDLRRLFPKKALTITWRRRYIGTRYTIRVPTCFLSESY